MTTVPSIRKIWVKNYGCIKEAEISLTQLHAFIGPNDSGKSTILRAIRTIVQFTKKGFRGPTKILDDKGARSPNDPEQDYPVTINDWKPFDPGLFADRSKVQELRFQFDDRLSYQVVVKPNVVEEALLADGKLTLGPEPRDFNSVCLNPDAEPNVQKIRRHFKGAGARYLKLDSFSVREPSALIPDKELVDRMDERGRGLPGIYDAMLGRNPDAFFAIREEVRRLFPSVDTIQNPAITTSTKELRVKLKTGESVPSSFVSDGLLMFLAFSALQYIEPVSVLLVEEPENGLHPARIADIVKILRGIAEAGTQVVIATHSPLVVNELKPEEVSVVTRDPQKGTQVISIKDTAHFEERMKVFALGELWVSYSNGEDEKDLISGLKP